MEISWGIKFTMAILLLSGVLWLVGWLAKERALTGMSRAPKKRPWLNAFWMAGSFVLIMLISLYTWQDIHQLDDVSQNLTISEFDAEKESGSDVKTPSNDETTVKKVLLQLVFFREYAGEYVPLYVNSATINWPEEKDKSVLFDGNVEGIDFKYNYNITEISRVKYSSDLVFHYKYTNQYGDSTSYGNNQTPRFLYEHLYNSTSRQHPLSLFGGKRSTTELYQCLIMNSLEENDQLKETPAREYLNRLSLVDTERRHLVVYRSSDHMLPPGMQLLAKSGLSLLFLGFSAICLCFFFKWRNGTPLLLVVSLTSILFVAGFERYALATHLSVIKDAKTPLHVRLQTCDKIEWSFFFRDTARREMRSALNAGNIPSSLNEYIRWTLGNKLEDFDPTDDWVNLKYLVFSLRYGSPDLKRKAFNYFLLSDKRVLLPEYEKFFMIQVCALIDKYNYLERAPRPGEKWIQMISVCDYAEYSEVGAVNVPDGIEITKLRPEKQMALEFILKDEISQRVHLPVGKVWKADFSCDEFLSFFGLYTNSTSFRGNDPIRIYALLVKAGAPISKEDILKLSSDYK